MKKAVNQWCFPEGTPFETMFSISKKAGLDGVELNLYAAGQTGLTVDTTVEEARQVRNLAKFHGIELKSLSTALLWEFPLSSDSPEILRVARKIVQKQLEIAQWLEMDCILVVPGIVTPQTSYQACYTRSQEQLADLGQEALRRGIHIGVENVWNRFLLSPLEMSRFLDEIGLPSVRAYFDVGNALQFGYPQDWIRTLGKRIVKIHVKDFLLNVGNIHGFVPLFAGDVDWDSVRTALNGIGYDDYLTAELNPYQHYPVHFIFDTAKKLDTLIGDGGSIDT